MRDLVDFQWDLLHRFREVKGSQDGPRILEYILLGYRINAVMRMILKRRDSEAEAPIVPEFKREISRLEESIQAVRA